MVCGQKDWIEENQRKMDELRKSEIDEIDEIEEIEESEEESDEDEDDKKIGFFEEDEEDSEDEEKDETFEEDQQPDDDEEEDIVIKSKKGKSNKKEKVSKLILSRLQERAPKLFKKKDKYSKKCQGDQKPIIITANEKENIDKHDGNYNTSSYANALLMEYDNKTQYYFICPRYWSVIENRSLTETEVNEGIKSKKYKIITRKNENTESGNVYEFSAFNKKKENRIAEIKGIANDAGIHLPCCYDIQKREKDKNSGNYVSEYISEKNPPLEKDRIGYLPTSLELFFNIHRNEFMNLKKPKQNIPILFRLGVENVVPVQQSFLACFANICSYIDNTNDQQQPPANLTVDNLIERMVQAIDLDRFIQLQNGSLVSTFTPTNMKEHYDNITIEKYQETNFYQSL
jgi:hypothetical protein